jgi:hypothetical protein
MSWLFKAAEREERRREREEESRKHEEVTRMMADLFIRHNSMTPAEMIGELEQMHRFYAVATWAPSEERGGYFYQIATDLSHTPLTPEEISRLVAMLLWPEFRAYKDSSAPSCLVSAAIQNPSEAYIPTLTEHLAWLEKEIKPLGSSQYRADIASAIRLTKAAIQACRIGA